jgi:hypothetical protein
MKNFNLIKRTGSNVINWRFTATVDVTSGFFRKKVSQHVIHKEYAGHWYFVDTGKLTPNHDAEQAERAFEAVHGPIKTAPVFNGE